MHVQVEHSPYNGLAYCERFPRNFDPSNPSDTPEWPLYWAQRVLRAAKETKGVFLIRPLDYLGNWAICCRACSSSFAPVECYNQAVSPPRIGVPYII
eukprot:scaffold208293_cov17-Tisochrysis_lutea.AAC.2